MDRNSRESHDEPDLPRWTHIALRVCDIDTTIAWYEDNTPLVLLHRREDESGYGAWLGHDDQQGSPFVLVVSQFLPEHDPFEGMPTTILGPFAHLGIELANRAAVDAAASKAEADGTLAMKPTQLPDPVGYVCMVADPDGNMIEFSHAQGIYDVVSRRSSD